MALQGRRQQDAPYRVMRRSLSNADWLHLHIVLKEEEEEEVLAGNKHILLAELPIFRLFLLGSHLRPSILFRTCRHKNLRSVSNK
jgi:hypothetical protein